MSDNLVKPERPGGFGDYLTPAYLVREWLIRTTDRVFRSYGFDPVETPRVEFLKTLSGETSDTGKNIFHIRSSGESEPLALPFDHTVPFARVLAANPFDAKRKSGIRLPWRRMVVGPVFRADSPQSGRYRQFYQFDVDIAGCASMIADAEIIAIMVETMEALHVPGYEIRINNRKILNGISELLGITDRGQVKKEKITTEMMRILDKMDKIGKKGVEKELARTPESDMDPAPALNADALGRILSFLEITGDNAEKLDACTSLFSGISIAEEGIQELREILEFLDAMGVTSDRVVVDFSIARGLDYYTGPVMEAVLTGAREFGSVFSGGRYNNLVSRFTGKELPAVGSSLGVDRLIAALEHLKALPDLGVTPAEVMVIRIDQGRDMDYLSIAKDIRKAGKNAEVCLAEDTTFKKQFNFAIARGVSHVVIAGENEFEKGTVQVKNLQTREQVEIAMEELTDYFREK